MVDIAWSLFAEAATYMLPGFVFAGFLHAFVQSERLLAPLRKRGSKPVWLATLIGAPLPLCSCSVIPTAVTLRRKGASAGATSAFLISTPETSVTSILLTYGLLGPVYAIARPVAAIVTAVAAGLSANRIEPEPVVPQVAPPDACCEDAGALVGGGSIASRALSGLRFAFVDLLEEVFPWIVVGVLVAAAIQTWIPEDTLLAWLGQPAAAMAIVIVVGVPLYVCAEASTPIAASLIAGGVSPGVALVFLLVGPATNVGSLGILRRELGGRVILVYVLAIVVVSVAMGLALDRVLAGLPQVDVVAHADHGHGVSLLGHVSAALFALLGTAAVLRARLRRH